MTRFQNRESRMPTKKRNPQDATLRNIRALKARLERAERRTSDVLDLLLNACKRITKLEEKQ